MRKRPYQLVLLWIGLSLAVQVYPTQAHAFAKIFKRKPKPPKPSPTPTPTPTPTPPYTNPRRDLSPVCRSIPEGTGGAPSTTQGSYASDVQAAIDLAKDGNADPRWGNILDVEKFLSSVISFLNQRNICGVWEYPADHNNARGRLYVRKASPNQNEYYSILDRDSIPQRVYLSTYTPANPLPPMDPDHDVTCGLPKLPNTVERDCPRVTYGVYQQDVNATLAQMVSEERVRVAQGKPPLLFNLNEHAAGVDENLMILPGQENTFMGVFIDKMRFEKLYCVYPASGGGFHVKKTTNDWNEYYDIRLDNSSGSFMLSNYSIRAQCAPATF